MLINNKANSLFAPGPPPHPHQSAVAPGEESWPLAIPPPHVSFAPGSSYLLDALVPVPLPFFFSCCRFFSLLWSSGSWRFRNLPPMAGHLRVLTAPLSHCHLPQLCFRLDLVRASPVVDRLAFYFLVLALFFVVFCFCLFSLFFGFGFSLYCSFSVCFVCVLFLQFCRSPSRQFRRPPPTVRLYSAPPQ
jgi:hypothetical protein